MPSIAPSRPILSRRIRPLVGVAALVATVLPFALATPAAAVVGGDPIAATELNFGGDYEWLVGVELSGGGGCSGTLVAPRYVLTAAHCENPSVVTIGSGATPVAITDAVVHPSYRGGSEADVQVLRLAADQTARPLAMATAPDGLTVGATVTVAGFGTTDGGDSPPAEGTMSVSSLLTEQFEATPFPANSCAGDSGGPVIASGPGGPVLVGVTSYGDGACALHAGSMRVAAFRSFIDPLLVPGNRPPVVASGGLETAVDTPVEIPIEFSDPDGLELTLDDVVDQVATNGTLSVCAGTAPPTTCTFTPDPGFEGIASYAYTVSDGEDETTGTWEILVGEPAANQAPVVSGGALTTAVDTPVEVSIDFSDPDGPALGWDDLTGIEVANGSLTACASVEVVPTTCTFQPDPGFSGIALVGLAVSDGELVGRGDWLIHVGTPVPPDGGAAPVVAGGTVDTAPDTPVAVPLSIVDPESGPLGLDSILLLDVTGNGTFDGCAVASPPSGCTFTPDPGFVGTTFLRITATDGTGVGRGEWRIRVRQPVGGQPPVALSGELSIVAGATFEIPYEFSDPDGTVLGFDDIVAFDEQSPITWVDCASFEVPTTCTYRWDRPFGGVAALSYTVADGDGETEAVWIITAVDNQPPEAPGGVLATPVDTPVAIPIEFSDPDSSPLGPLTELSRRTDETVVGGTLAGCAATTAPTTCTFTPDPGFVGTAWYSYTVSDGVQGVTVDWLIHVGGSVPVDGGDPPQLLGEYVQGTAGDVVDVAFTLVDPEDGALDGTAVLDVGVQGPSTLEGCDTGPDFVCQVRLPDESATDSLVVVFTDGTHVARGEILIESVVPQSSVSGTVTIDGAAPGTTAVVVLAYEEADGLHPTDAVHASAGGDFHFAGLPAGTYRFAFVASTPGTGIEWHQESPTRAGAVAHVVTTTTVLTGVDGTLAPSTAISGTVTDESGEPVGGVVVVALGDGAGLAQATFAVTDSDGRYVVRDLPAGPQRLVFVAPGYYLLGTTWFGGVDRASATELEPVRGSVLTGVDAVLGSVPGISGTVTGPDGEPVPGATVWAYDADDGYVGSAVATTFGDGTYVLALPASGAYRILVVPPAGSGLTALWHGPSTTRAGATEVHAATSTLVEAIDVTLG
jgi:hypothetical protein